MNVWTTIQNKVRCEALRTCGKPRQYGRRDSISLTYMRDKRTLYMYMTALFFMAFSPIRIGQR